MEYVNKANATLQIFIQRQIRDSTCLGGAQFNKNDLKCRVIMATREVSTKGSGNRTKTRRSEKALLSAEQ